MLDMAWNTTFTAPDVFADITIINRSSEQISPENVMFGTVLTGFDTAGPIGAEVYDASLHEVYRHWNYGDSYTYQHVTKVPTPFRNSQFGFGPIGSHTYRAPGVYTVTCMITEPSSGKLYIATRDITISDPDTVFSDDAQTIVLDTNNAIHPTYPNALVYTTCDAIIAAIKALNDETIPIRVIVKAAQSFTISTPDIGRSNWPTVHFLAEPGTPPIFTPTAEMVVWDNNGSFFDKDLVMQGIEVIGAWNPVNETGSIDKNMMHFIRNAPTTALFDNVVIRDAGDSALYTQIASFADNYRIIANDCFIDGWRNFGVYAASITSLTLTGTKIEQNPLANAGGPKDDQHNNHGPIRIARANSSTHVIAHSSQFYSRNSWNPTSGPPYGQQPCWRYDTSGVGGSFLSLHCNVFEGGDEVMVFGVQSGDTNSTINAIIAQNYLLATHQSRRGFKTEKPGMTFRNNIITAPSPTAKIAPGFVSFLLFASDGDTAAPIKSYNNTLISHSSNVVTEDGGDGGFLAVDVDNNVLYLVGSTSDGPLDTTQLFTPSELGYKDEFTALEPAYATPAAEVWGGGLLAGAGALADADLLKPHAWDDFFGVERPVAPSRGAMELA